MKTFKDINGRAWSIVITLPVLERVKELTGMQLMQLVESAKNNAIETLQDPVELLKILVAVIEPEKQGMDLEVFKVAISDGDVLEQAADALLTELVDFLPRRQRSVKQSALSRLREIKPHQLNLADQMLDHATKKMTKDLAKLQSYFSSGNSEASPESILDSTASAT